MLSFVIPAHNEETEIGPTLRAIHTAAATLGQTYEIVVANDSSTDRTGEIAEAAGARVVPVSVRHIAAARNAGWRASSGEQLIFVDADTRVTSDAVRHAVEAMEAGAAGGGSAISFEGTIPLYGRMLLPVFLLAFRVAKMTGGCFFFVRREALEKVGGWSEQVYASEEIELAKALKAQFGRAKFVILRDRVATSGRKLRTFTPGDLLGILGKYILHGRKVVESRAHLDLWYGERRADPEAETRHAANALEKKP